MGELAGTENRLEKENAKYDGHLVSIYNSLIKNLK